MCELLCDLEWLETAVEWTNGKRSDSALPYAGFAREQSKTLGVRLHFARKLETSIIGHRNISNVSTILGSTFFNTSSSRSENASIHPALQISSEMTWRERTSAIEKHPRFPA